MSTKKYSMSDGNENFTPIKKTRPSFLKNVHQYFLLITLTKIKHRNKTMCRTNFSRYIEFVLQKRLVD